MAANSKRKADLKVVLIGAMEVGKTCLIIRYIQDTFDEGVAPTLGASFFLKQYGPHNIAIWDTAGQERFAGLSSFYCRDAGAAILAYDIRSKESFEQLRTKFLPLITDGECLKVLVGTKLDLIDDDDNKRTVTRRMAESFAQEINEEFLRQHTNISLPVFETSSKNNVGVKEVFQYIFDARLGTLPTEYKTKKPDGTITLERNSAQIHPKDVIPKKKCC